MNSKRAFWIPKNNLNILLLIVIILNYFDVNWHYWFVKILGGYVIKVWYPTALILYLIVIKLALSEKKITFNNDNLNSIRLFSMLYLSLGFLSLIAHDEGSWYLGKYSLFMFMPLVLFAIIIARLRDNEEIKKVLQILFICGFIMSIYVELLYLTHTLQFKTILTNFGEISFNAELYNFRLMSSTVLRHAMPGLSPNPYAIMLVPLIFVGLYLARNSKGLLKSFYYCSTLIIFIADLRTVSKTAFMAAIISLAIFLWYRRKIFLALFSLITVFAGIVFFNAALFYRMIMMFAYINMFSMRQYIMTSKFAVNLRMQPEQHFFTIKGTLLAFSKSPFFGVGMNQMEIINEHNHYLELLGTNGLFGFIPYVALLSAIILISRKQLLIDKKNAPSYKEMGVALFSGLIAFVIYLNAMPTEYYFYWIWLGLTVAWARNCWKARHRKKQITPPE